MEYSVGDTIGPYRLLRALGQGTAGTVFEVEHARIGRRAAMKIVHPDSMIPGNARRLFAEAQAVNLIGNPHIVQITDVLEPGEGQPVHALVMELLEGISLADLVANQQPLPVDRLLPIMAEVCDALAAVHAAGFIHRDLKPENVLLVRHDSRDDFVKLLDFGLVKTTRLDVASPRATVQGTFVGSPAYASPEQASGKEVDHRTDLYAVGVMLYELVTGQLPFEAESIGDVLIKQITQPAPHLPEAVTSTEVGQTLDAIIQTCLAKDPAARTVSAAELAGMFRQLGAGAVAAANDVFRSHDAPVRTRRTRRLRAIPPVLAIAIVALFVATRAATNATNRPTPTAPAAMPAATLKPTVAEIAPIPEPTIEPLETPPPAKKRGARDPIRIDKATTLDPYR